MSSTVDTDDRTSQGIHKKLSQRMFSRADSMEIESYGIDGRKKSNSDKDQNWWTVVHLAFQSIGVVYGDIGTSPLYTLSGVFPDGVRHEEDVIGALSIIFYTLTLIPVVKYVFIVLQANDNGDGGTFALYSLICRHAKIGLLPSQEAEDREVSTFNCEKANTRKKLSTKVRTGLEKSKTAHYVLLIATMLGTSMVIGDGILTPCISVLSAVGGIKSAAPDKIDQDAVIWISVAIVVALFMIQRFGTDKIGYSFAPILTVWFISIAIIGIYNWLKYDPLMIRAVNPYYIYTYFQRNKIHAWLSLGGTVLCITGAEALFADLGHFSIKSIRISTTCLVYPSLLCAYLGQFSYLSKHLEDVGNIFYKNLPEPVYWPMFALAVLSAIIASQAMISGSFAMIQQSLSMGCFPRVKIVHTSAKYEGQVFIPEVNYIFMILCVIVILAFRDQVALGNAYGVAVVMVMTLTSAFVILIMIVIWKTHMLFIIAYFLIIVLVELLYLSALLCKFTEGGYIPIVFALVLMSVMYIWNYVFRRKYYYELQGKISPKEIKDSIVHTSPHRIPGLAIFYSELVHGIPPIFKHYVGNIPALHTVLIFVSFKSIHTSKVRREERFLFRRVQPSDLKVFRCVVRYGYKESRHDEEPFEKMLVDKLKQFIKDGYKFSAAIQTSIAEDEVVDNTDINVHGGMLDQREAMEGEIEELDAASRAGITHLVGESDVIASKGSRLFKRIVINYLYSFIRKNSRESEKVLNIPHEKLMKVGMIYEL